MSLPALDFVRGDFTEVWAPTLNLPLFGGVADQVRSIASTMLDRVGVFDEPLPPILYEFDRIVSWYGTNREEFREAVHALPFEFHPALPPADCNSHAVDFYLRQVGAPLGATPRVPASASKRDFIAIHPFSGSPRKNWPLETFQQVAAGLPMPVEWAATEHGVHRFEDLGDVANWLASARAYLGNDSGISHLAAAVGTPAVVLFGPTDPAVWAPRGASVTILKMQETTVAQVTEALCRLC